MERQIKVGLGLLVFIASLAIAFVVVEDKITDLNNAQDAIEALTEEGIKDDRKNARLIEENRLQICAAAKLVEDFPRVPLPGETPEQLIQRFINYEIFTARAAEIDCEVVLRKGGFERQSKQAGSDSSSSDGSGQDSSGTGTDTGAGESPPAEDSGTTETPAEEPPPSSPDPDPNPDDGGDNSSGPVGDIVDNVQDTGCTLTPILC